MAAVEHNDGPEPPSERTREEADVEYGSDSDEGTSAMALRRRVASDDEDDVEEEETHLARRDEYYDDELENNEGGPPEDEEGEEEEEEVEEEYEDVEDEGILMAQENKLSKGYDNEEESNFAREGVRKPQGSATNGESNEMASEEKKDAEPFVVPTSGAFYMHDDRFRYNGLARPRRSAGGRRLWEAKDEKPWVHDLFEELQLIEEGYIGQGARGRRGRGRQGRVQSRSRDAGRGRGKSNNRERDFDDSLRTTRRVPGRGRGVRRAKMDDYEFRDSRRATRRIPPPPSHGTEGNTSVQPSNLNPPASQVATKPEDASSKKSTVSSMLKVSSPPFFPTGAVMQNLSVVPGTSKVSEENFAQREVPSVGRMSNTSRGVMKQEVTGFNPAPAMRVSTNPEINSNIVHVPSNGVGEVGIHRNSARGSGSIQQQLPKTGSGGMNQQQWFTRAEASTRTMDQPLSAQSNAVPSSSQPVRMSPVPGISQQTGQATPLAAQSMRVQQPLQAQQQIQAMNQAQTSSVQPAQSQTVVFPMSLPAKPATDLKSSQSISTPHGSNIGNETINRGAQGGNMQQVGRGSVVYGSSSVNNGLRGVVQFSGQPQAGLGVPTLGVNLPGYANQPQFSFPNSAEVTWIPILAGGGSLSSNYNPPYIAVDGGSSAMYYTQQQGTLASNFPSSLGDMNSSKTASSSTVKPSQRTESDDLGQQRRRYSQMTFGEERR
ncbi:hypothetical protein KP509_15G073300 [Ceratopteris richardii]|uniref:Btz domain-containing protein n=1 Tax=Ceratopteris richardii TaxID=49495 RepID=A0A8T2T9P1_CERRI|nr:hypothetical protein KP509_15G073300 [Ceratopteris richardii]KAH7405507.1 hypothetical protein KP509_15G073300 [Ceratopteris richardii]KAH7405508.1 hypothetical protein KP509_15G073300 [Ceratopteris richardii]KAH7405509.1 hypothetical protein KP509_15G073300 [Ceratopteris richardii]KAH7405510.1 hypothetical protein KP509_15G073300 [Ceratopteris richardii]